MTRHVRPIALVVLLVLAAGCETFKGRHTARGVDREASVARSDPMNRDALAFPTGERKSSVLLVEKVSPKQIRLNQP